MREYNLNYYFDENLQEVADNERDMEMYVQEMKIALDTAQGPAERVKILGQLATYLRILRRLGEARDYLSKSLEIVERHHLNQELKVLQQLRLAHVYQWQCHFEISNTMFEELLKMAKTQDLGYLTDFIWQHTGKNYYDQMNWSKALECFEMSLKLRELRQAPPEQLESSRLSIRATLQKMN